MTESFNKKQIGLTVACALAMGVLSGVANAQNINTDNELITDTAKTVYKSGFGLCWHSGFGPPPASTPECDPNYVAYVAPPVLKAVAVAPPAITPDKPAPVTVAPETPYVPAQRPAKRDRN